MPNKKDNLILLTGNEAVALGALAAGLKFYAAYPMTPASNILHFLAAHEREYKIIVKQTEDEIAAINMVIGASIAGARAMTATSGGGFALMTEGFGFGGITETPFVVVVAMRPGPATGLPTWSGQGDLRQVLHAGQDEFPRIILAPGSIEECFQLTCRAFDWADKFHVPAVILIDKFLGESQAAVQSSKFKVINQKSKIKNQKSNNNLTLQCGGQALEQFSNKTYKRYQFTKIGVSERAIPGAPNHIFIANSDEHDEYGFSEEDAANRAKMTAKRMRKLVSIAKEMPVPVWYGHKSADLTLICWGSQLGPCLEALKYANSSKFKVQPCKLAGQSSKLQFKVKSFDGQQAKKQFNNLTIKQFNVLHFSHLLPLPILKVKKELAKIKKSICLENNYSGVLADYLFEKTGFRADKKLLKYDGRPFFVEEVAGEIQNVK